MSQKVEFVLDGKDAGAVRAWLAVQRAQDSVAASLGKIDDAQAKNAKSAADWDRIAQKTLKDLETPQQRHNMRMKDLNELLNRGKLNQEQFAAAARKSQIALDATQQSSSWLDSIGTKLGVAAAGFFTVSTAVGGIRTALSAVRESNQKFIEDAEKAGAAYDKIFRQYRIQAGLSEIGGEKAKQNILKQAEVAGFNEDRAGAAATALVSAGVKPELASGGALAGFLATLNAQGLRDSDPSQYADAMTAVLQSNGMEVNEENMTKLGVQLQSAPIKDTKLKLTSLPQLASISAGLSGAMTQQEQLATFAVGGSAMGSFDKMATSMADITKNLRVAASKPDAVEYLKKVGLKPEQVDFVGEDFGTVMTTLKTALDKAPEELRTQVLSKVIEGGNVSAFNVMQNNLDKILKTAQTMDGADAQALYANDVAVGSSGRGAAAERQKLRRNRLLAERDTQGDLVRAEMVQKSLEDGQSPLMQSVAGGVFDATRFLGLGGYVGADDNSLAASAASIATNQKGLGVAAGLGKQALRGLVPSVAPLIPDGTGQITSGSLGISLDAASAGETSRAAVDQRLASSIKQATEEAQKPLVEALNKNTVVTDQANRGGALKPNTTPAAPVRSASNNDVPGG